MQSYQIWPKCLVINIPLYFFNYFKGMNVSPEMMRTCSNMFNGMSDKDQSNMMNMVT